MTSISQFNCAICGQGFEQKSRLARHMDTSHPPSAPSAADIEKILSGIQYPQTKEALTEYVSQKRSTVGEDLFNLIKCLPNRTYLIGVLTSYTTANASHRHEKHPCTQLWVYSEPVQKGPALFSSIPAFHELEKANKANIEFNKGVEAGHLRTLTFNSTNQLNCPSGKTKEFWPGWKSATQFTLKQYKTRLTARGNYKSSHHDSTLSGSFSNRDNNRTNKR